MAYTITLSNGTVLTTIQDRTVDSSTSLTLIGRNYAGYGQYIANDLVYLLENFANTSAPAHALVGQLWYNSNTQTMQVWNGATWAAVGVAGSGDTVLPSGYGLTLQNTGAPSGQRRWRISVSNTVPYVGMLVFQLMSDDGATVLNTVLALDGVNNLIIGRATYS